MLALITLLHIGAWTTAAGRSHTYAEVSSLSGRSRSLQNHTEYGSVEIMRGPDIFGGASGGLEAWGYMNVDGYVPERIANEDQSISDITLGKANAMALLQGGKVIVWGDNTYGQLRVPSDIAVGNGTAQVVRMAVGYTHVLAVTDAGALYAWGDTTAIPTTPLTNVQDAKAGTKMSLVLLKDKTAVAYGQSAQPPKDIQGQINAIAVAIRSPTDFSTAVSERSVCVALLTNGSVVAWEDDGDASWVPPSLAAQTVQQIEGRYGFVLAKVADGTVVAWKPGVRVELPPISVTGSITNMDAYNDTVNLVLNGNAVAYRYTPASNGFTQVGLINPDRVASGVQKSSTWGQFNLFLTISAQVSADGPIRTAAYAWSGYKAGVKKVSVGKDHVVVLFTDGTPSAYGQDVLGQLEIPNDVRQKTGNREIAAGYAHTLLVTSERSIVAWGSNGNDTQESVVPAAQTSLQTVKVAAGLQSSFAIVNATSRNATGGYVVQWGRPKLDNWTMPVGTDGGAFEIVANLNSAAVLMGNGKVKHWNTANLTVPNIVNASISKFIRAGGEGVGVVLQNNTVVVWNTNATWFQVFDQVADAREVYMYITDSLSRVKVYIRTNAGLLYVLDEQTYRSNRTVSFRLEPTTQDDAVLAVACSEEFDIAIATALAFSPPAGSIGPAIAQGLSTKKSISVGAIIGIVIAVVAVVAIIAGGAFFYVSRTKKQHEEALISAKKASEADAAAVWIGKDADTTINYMKIPGLADGEVFTRATAMAYSWLNTAGGGGDGDASKAYVPIEAGINDIELDNMVDRKAVAHEPKDSLKLARMCPVVKLKKEEVREKLQLLPDGLLGRGATALVFKCTWKDRFGPNAILAAKVLKDGYEGDIEVLQSFCYEANVLANSVHPNIVRVYGYCLDPPNVCIILEVLPTSLKDLLYKPMTGLPSSSMIGITIGQTELQQAIVAGYGKNNAGLMTGTSGWTTMNSTATSTSSTNTGAAATFVDTNTSTAVAEVAAMPLVPARPSGVPDVVIEINADQAAKNGGVASKDEEHDEFAFASGPPAASGAVSSGLRRLTLLEVLLISRDVSAGLSYLHNKSQADSSSMGRSMASQTDMGAIPEDLANKMDNEALVEVQMAASGKRIVHRDMKPANVLINSKGVAKISDFGLAREHQQTTLQTVHMAAGTLPYMAPELLCAVGAKHAGMPATNKVDVYSLGMMMWEMLSGQMPWKGTMEASLISAVLAGRRPTMPDVKKEATADDPSSDPKAVSLQPASLQLCPDMNDLIKQCWQKREHRRPTAAEVHKAVVDLLHKYMPAP